MDTKRCSRCKQEKQHHEFHKASTSTAWHKLQGRCKQCQAEEINAYRKTEKGRRSRRGANVKLTYGITLDELNTMTEAQQNLCAICRQPETAIRAGRVKQLSIDHNHATGKVRGLLCMRCNAMLGNAREQPEILQQAIAYLALHSEASP